MTTLVAVAVILSVPTAIAFSLWIQFCEVLLDEHRK